MKYTMEISRILGQFLIMKFKFETKVAYLDR